MRFLLDTRTRFSFPSTRPLVPIAKLLLTTIAILLAFGAWGCYQFGSIRDALLYATGRHMYVSNPNVRLYGVKEGIECVVEFRVVNHLLRPFRVIACTTSCSCTALETLPISIPASSYRVLKVRYIPGNGRVDTVSIRLFTDNPGVPEIPLRIDAQIAHSGT
jgi:hypothetical protein